MISTLSGGDRFEISEINLIFIILIDDISQTSRLRSMILYLLEVVEF